MNPENLKRGSTERGQLGPSFYARALRMLHEEPSTTMSLARHLQASEKTVIMVVRRMHALGIVHVDGWTADPKTRRPIFAAGAGEDCPKPRPLRMRAKTSNTLFRAELAMSAEAVRFAHVVKTLATLGPLSTRELSEEMAVCLDVAQRLVRALRREQLVYIAEWNRPHEHCTWQAGWAFGFERRSASRPKAVGSIELQRNARSLAQARQQQIELLHRMAGNASNLQQFQRQA